MNLIPLTTHLLFSNLITPFVIIHPFCLESSFTSSFPVSRGRRVTSTRLMLRSYQPCGLQSY